MQIDFSGQVVLVTGATRGIGQQLAKDFANLGAVLLLTGTNPVQVEALNEEAGPNVRYYCVDMSNAESTQAFVEQLDALERIDVCVNNAGINRLNYFGDTRLEDWYDMLGVNLRGPFLITRAVSRLMKRRRYGRIVNIASIWGVISRARRSIYSVTKYGLRGLTVSVANELAQYNVLVNAVSPGFVLTELTRRNLGEREMADLASQVPMRRMATPDEISRVVLFVASSLNTYLTGQNIIVDGGFVNV